MIQSSQGRLMRGGLKFLKFPKFIKKCSKITTFVIQPPPPPDQNPQDGFGHSSSQMPTVFIKL